MPDCGCEASIVYRIVLYIDGTMNSPSTCVRVCVSESLRNTSCERDAAMGQTSLVLGEKDVTHRGDVTAREEKEGPEVGTKREEELRPVEGRHVPAAGFDRPDVRVTQSCYTLVRSSSV